MGLIKKYSIDKVNRSIDMVDVIGRFVKLKKRGAEYAGLSPFNNERTPSFKVNSVKNVWKDFSSGKGGNGAISFLMEHQNMSYPQAIEYVANMYSIELDREDGTVSPHSETRPIIKTPKPAIKYSQHPAEITTEYGRGFKTNNLIQFLKDYFEPKMIQETILRYQLGTSTHYPGAMVFWYIDESQTVTSGKIMQYNWKTGSSKVNNGKASVNWMHSLLGLKDFNRKPVLFGTHLLSNAPTENICGITESEKTACILTMIRPEITWLAVGGSEITIEHLRPLRNRNIILFPDTPGKDTENTPYKKWTAFTELATGNGYQISCSNMLERLCTPDQKGYDLADYYLPKVKGLVKRIGDTPTEQKKEKPLQVLSPDEWMFNKLLDKNNVLSILMDEFDLVTNDGERPRIIETN